MGGRSCRINSTKVSFVLVASDDFVICYTINLCVYCLVTSS